MTETTKLPGSIFIDVREWRDTHAYYAPGFPTLTAKRACPTCVSTLEAVPEALSGLDVVDYIA